MADLGAIFLGAVGIIAGARAISRGASELSRGLGLAGDPRTERDPGPKGSIGRPVTTIAGGRYGTTRVFEVRNLDERINAVRDRARRARMDPKVIAWARAQVTRKCGPRGHGAGQWCIREKDTLGEIGAIFYGMRRDVRYTSDPVGIDLFENPQRTLQQKGTDCDGYAGLGCGSLMAIGIPCRFRVVRTKGADTWNHIYIEADASRGRGEKWIPLDASEPVKPGWAVPRSMIAEERIFEVAA